MLNINKVKANLEAFLLEIKKYKISYFLNPIIFTPIFAVIGWFLTSAFVKSVKFYSTYIPYLYFILVAIGTLEYYWWIQGWLPYFFNSAKSVKNIFFRGVWEVKAAILLYNLIYVPANLLVYFFWAELLTSFAIPAKVLIASLIATILTIPFNYTIGEILSIIAMKLKKNSSPIIWFFGTVATILTLTYFSLSIFPKDIRELLEILIPSMGVVEEMRKWAFLGEFNVSLLLSAFLVSILYSIAITFVFKKLWDDGRRKGWLYLE